MTYQHTQATVLATIIGLGIAGCGGGHGGGGADAVTIASRPSPAAARGTGAIDVTVTDFLGAPVPNAKVSLHELSTGYVSTTFASTNGIARFEGLAAGRWAVSAEGTWSGASSPERLLSLYVPEVTLSDGARLPVALAMVPRTEPSGGVAGTRVEADGVSADGRTLQFSLQVLHVESLAYKEYEQYSSPSAMVVAPCLPSPGNDAGSIRPDCVTGPEGFDAAYANWIPVGYDTTRGNPWGEAISLEVLSPSAGSGEGSAFAAALLLDQSDRATLGDLEDMRLTAAKYFMSLLSASDTAVLAAFASDDVASGRRSLLPHEPVTIFPVEQPQFTAQGRGYLAAIDGLASQEGGAGSLYAAIDRMLDFIGAEAANSVRQALVVVSDGQDAACGALADCRLRRDALVRKSREQGISIITVGFPSPDGVADREALGHLAQGAPGSAAFWVSDARQLPNALAAVNRYLRGLKYSYRSTFRIVADRDGVFAPGRTVMGVVRAEACPWDCYYTNLPFVVTIP